MSIRGQIDRINATTSSVLQSSLFLGKQTLQSVSIPNVNEIPGSCFTRCSNIKSIIFSNNLINIGDYAFQNAIYYNNNPNFVLPDSVENLGNSSFRACIFGHFKMPKNIKTINGLAFYGTYNTVYDMSEVLSVPVLGSNVFANSSNVNKTKGETKDALQTLYDSLIQGQQKKVVKNPEVKALFDRYGVDYEG